MIGSNKPSGRAELTGERRRATHRARHRATRADRLLVCSTAVASGDRAAATSIAKEPRETTRSARRSLVASRSMPSPPERRPRALRIVSTLWALCSPHEWVGQSDGVGFASRDRRPDTKAEARALRLPVVQNVTGSPCSSSAACAAGAAALRPFAPFAGFALAAGFACGTGLPSSGAGPCLARSASPSALVSR